MKQPPQHHFRVNHEKARYYQAHLDRNLLGDWTLRKVRERSSSTAWPDALRRGGSFEDGIEQVQAIAKRRGQRSYRRYGRGE